jgi:hypothetical protein
MMRILTTLAAALGLSGVASAQQLMIGSAQVRTPAGWTEVKKEDARIALRAPDGKQQVTISIMRFGADASFEDFKRLCQLRLEAEKKDSPDCFVQAEPPHEIKGAFGMFYSGGFKQSGRVFSGYLSLTKRELVTIYLEGLGIDPKEHLQTFKALVEGLTRK